MEGSYVRYFDVYEHRIKITLEFDKYNETRSKQEKEIGLIEEKYTGDKLVLQLKEDLDCLIGNAFDSFKQIIENSVHSIDDVAVIGFSELQCHYYDLLPRIGKRMIFKYTPNEYISVDEVAGKIYLDAEAYFSDFVQEAENFEQGKEAANIQIAYNRLQQSHPNMIGIGFDARDAMEIAAGNVALGAGMSILRGIGGQIASAIQSSKDKENEKKIVSHGKSALYEAYQDLIKQLMDYVFQTLNDFVQSESDKVCITQFQNNPPEEEKELNNKLVNYKNAYKQGDISSDRYIEFLVAQIEKMPYKVLLFYDLYQVALDLNNEEAQKSILTFTDYLGLDIRMKLWMERNGVFILRQEEDSIMYSGLICKNCGKENRVHANFCSGCGAILGE